MAESPLSSDEHDRMVDLIEGPRFRYVIDAAVKSIMSHVAKGWGLVTDIPGANAILQEQFAFLRKAEKTVEAHDERLTKLEAWMTQHEALCGTRYKALIDLLEDGKKGRHDIGVQVDAIKKGQTSLLLVGAGILISLFGSAALWLYVTYVLQK